MRGRLNIVMAMTGARALSGGIAAVNLNLLAALGDVVRSSSASLTVLSLHERDEDRPTEVPEGMVFRGFQGRRIPFAAALLAAARRRPLFLFDHVTLALPLLPLSAARLAQTVIFAHGSEAWRRIRLTSRWSFRCASLCLTNSNFTLWRMRERIGAFRGEACQLGLPAQFGLNPSVPDEPVGSVALTAVDGREHLLGRRVLLLVARMDSREREKGYDLLIEVLPALAVKFPDVQVVLAGDGDDRDRVRALARRHEVDDRVFCPGFVPPSLLAELYRRCYAFVLPSRQEGFGLTYLEAMNYGKPCVGCADQGAEDVIDHGRTGLLVRDLRDSTELRESLLYLLDQPTMAREFGRAGFDRLHAHFTARHFQHRVREKLVAVLEQR